MKALIYPYKPGSESSKALSGALGIKRVAHKNSRFRGSPEIIVINWGASVVSDEVAKCNILNKPEAVSLASNKLKAFTKLSESARKTRKIQLNKVFHDLHPEHDAFSDVSLDFIGEIAHPLYGKINILETAPEQNTIARIPDFTTLIDKAAKWLAAGFTVVERHVLNGNSGAGIRLVEAGSDDELTPCPLYVRYMPKKQEYRVHVCKGQAVDIQRKARRKEVADEDINWKIRNHDNGFIFARNEAEAPPHDVIVQSVNAVKALGLDFGAVDVIFNDGEQRAYVLEVNTAPGLSGTTLEGYVARFNDIIHSQVVGELHDPLKGAMELPVNIVPRAKVVPPFEMNYRQEIF